MYSPSQTVLDDLRNRFTYHGPVAGQLSRYSEIRSEGGRLARLLVSSCPPSRELSLALTKIEEAVFWANAAIARNEKGIAVNYSGSVASPQTDATSSAEANSDFSDGFAASATDASLQEGGDLVSKEEGGSQNEEVPESAKADVGDVVDKALTGTNPCGDAAEDLDPDED